MARAAVTNCATLPSAIKAQRKECSRAISPPLLLRAEPAAPCRAGGGADKLHGAGRIHEPVLRFHRQQRARLSRRAGDAGALTQAVIAKAGGARGPLVLVVGSDIYVYESSGGARLAHARFRADRSSGFYELTAISHVGPALAYLAQIKANGDPRWRARLASLQAHVADVRAANERAADNWLDRLNQPAWSARKAQIRNMVDYACARTLDYIAALGDGERFTTAGVNDDFFNGTSALYPIPFVNVMIGTFMLEALRGPADVHGALARLKLDWPQAMALVMSRAGSNVSSGLTEGTNWLVLFLKAASGDTLPDDRIKIMPYAELRASLGEAQLAPEDLAYYVER